jgi:hypothetical protein
MTIKRGTVGSGLTEKPTVSWSDTADEADPEIAELIEAGTLDGMIAATERTCFHVLVEAGLPGKHGCYLFRKDTGEWREPSPPFGGWSIANTVEPVARAAGFAKDSPVGFAAAILDRIHWLRDNQRRGDHDRAALFAFYIGVLKAESWIKDEHEPTWESGKGTREGARKGAEARRAQVQARNRLIVESYRARRDKGQDRPTAMRHTAAEFELGKKQTSRIIGPE